MTRDRFRQVMAERRRFKQDRKRWAYEYIGHTVVAWKYYFHIKRVPVSQWDELLREKMRGVTYEGIEDG